MAEQHAVHPRAEQTKGVHVAVAQPRPVDKLDSQLEGGVGLPDEIGLVDTEEFVEQQDRRDRGLADAHRADRVGLDQGGLVILRPGDLRQGGGSHPAGGAAPDDDDIADALGHRRQAPAPNCESTDGIARTSSATLPSRERNLAI